MKELAILAGGQEPILLRPRPTHEGEEERLKEAALVIANSMSSAGVAQLAKRFLWLALADWGVYPDEQEEARMQEVHVRELMAWMMAGGPDGDDGTFEKMRQAAAYLDSNLF